VPSFTYSRQNSKRKIQRNLVFLIRFCKDVVNLKNVVTRIEKFISFPQNMCQMFSVSFLQTNQPAAKVLFDQYFF